MRIILTVCTIAAVGWGAYWFIGAAAMERGIVLWLDDRRNEGWQAEASSVDTKGFPNRFDTTLNELRLADPETGLAWSAPFFQILSLSYKPNHIIAQLPNNHVLTSPFQKIEFKNSDTRGSVVFEPNSKLTLDRLNFEAFALDVSSSDAWSLVANEIRLATRQVQTQENAHDIAISGLEIRPGGELAAIAGNAGLPPGIAELSIDTTIGFTAPWDLLAIEKSRPQPSSIDLRSLKAEWGELLFRATGDLDIDQNGQPTGEINVQAQNWQEMLNLAVSVGAVPEEILPTIRGGFSLVARMSGNPQHIDATLTVRNGLISIGPFPIGPAPKFVIR